MVVVRFEDLNLGDVFRWGGRRWVRVYRVEAGNAVEVSRIVAGYGGREYGEWVMIAAEAEVECEVDPRGVRRCTEAECARWFRRRVHHGDTEGTEKRRQPQITQIYTE